MSNTEAITDKGKPMEFPLYQALENGITRIDTGLGRPGLAACYLMEDSGRLAIIETGTAKTAPAVLELIRQRGYDYTDVDYVLITHVHLDHAGGAGALMAALPAAKLVVHPRAARHMADPSKLQAGAMAVYGERAYMQQYGQLEPIPEDRMIIVEDGSTLQLGDRVLRFFDTPGHARHHYCVYDEGSRGIFSGDTLGIVYREMSEGRAPFVMPATTPVQFDPQAMKQSVDRLMGLKAERIFLTHYGETPATQSHARQLHEHIDAYVAIALAHKDDGEHRQANIRQALLEHTLAALERHGSPLTREKQCELLAMDMMLNSQGLEVWLQQTAD
ncbi:MBL fold metallo-hydrolase [Gilvimarinus sp. F26214L]|uniref:MBL fold metallo-hydrolase n=1 Tax=Gilvimarinus sp. DZF01 TaxID=3461371 RepID=UPI004045F1DB